MDRLPGELEPFSTELGPVSKGDSFDGREVRCLVAEAVLGRVGWDDVAVAAQLSEDPAWVDAVGLYWTDDDSRDLVQAAGLAASPSEEEAAAVVVAILVERHDHGRSSPQSCIWSVAVLGRSDALRDVPIFTWAESNMDEIRTNPPLVSQVGREMKLFISEMRAWAAERLGQRNDEQP